MKAGRTYLLGRLVFSDLVGDTCCNETFNKDKNNKRPIGEAQKHSDNQ